MYKNKPSFPSQSIDDKRKAANSSIIPQSWVKRIAQHEYDPSNYQMNPYMNHYQQPGNEFAPYGQIPPPQEQEEDLTEFYEANPFVIGYSNHSINENRMADPTLNTELKYPMTFPIRGGALLLSNSRFFLGLNNLPGKDLDAERFDKLFRQLHFLPIISRENGASSMRRELNNFAELANSSGWQSAIIYITSHGLYNKVQGVHGRSLKIKEVLKTVNSILPGRPKVVFFDMCRGASHDDGYGAKPTNPLAWITTKFNIGAFNRDVEKEYMSLDLQDLLIAYASVGGYVSWVDNERGSIFFSNIAREISENAHRYDFHRLLTRANQNIALDWSPISRTIYMQVAEIHNTLTKELYLHPGYPKTY
ncbi:hypothetical protein SNEBB_005008 [Seison nebaliae]|nr:hypothetical protein SNEBB_005008 [Seison nebaliae]